MTKNMTEGRPIRLIISFAVPMFLGMLFQQFYSMVDTMIVGRFLGVEPLAGVGSTGALNFMVLGFCTGVCNGFAVPVAQMFGAKRESELHRYVANSVWLCIGIALTMTLTVTVLCRSILRLLDTPENVFQYAYVYIFIIFCGIPCTFLYNMVAAIIRSLGDSRTPVLFLALASVINIVLDIVFIIVLHMGVEGPALATVISQAISGVLCLLYMRKKYEILKIRKEEWALRRSYAAKLCYNGIPMGLQYSVTAVGSLIVQAAINSFGSVAVAGVTAAQKINMFITCPVEALGQTMAPYTAQNMGAGKIDRIEKGVRDTALCGLVLSAVLFAAVIFGGKQLCLLFLDSGEQQAVQYAYRFMVTTASGYFLLLLVNAVRFAIQGMGFSVFAILSGVMEMVARGLAGTVVVAAFGFNGLCFAHVMAWLFADSFLIPAFFYCRRRVERRMGLRPPVHKGWNGPKMLQRA